MGALSRLDAELFNLINGRLTTGVLDFLMPFVTDVSNFYVVVAFAAVLLIALGGKRDRVGVLILLVLVGMSDFSSALLKDLFARARPCHALEGVRLLAGCGDSFSMPSSHAANIFSSMVFLSIRYRRVAPAFLAVAIAVSYSRVYVGVHYPSDVLIGAAWGSLLAFGSAAAERLVSAKAMEFKRSKTDTVEL